MTAGIFVVDKNHVLLRTVVRSQQASLVTFSVYTVDTHLANTVFTGSLLEVSSYRVGVVLVYAAFTIIRESQADNLAEVLGCSSWAWAVVADGWIVVIWE